MTHHEINVRALGITVLPGSPIILPTVNNIEEAFPADSLKNLLPGERLIIWVRIRKEASDFGNCRICGFWSKHWFFILNNCDTKYFPLITAPDILVKCHEGFFIRSSESVCGIPVSQHFIFHLNIRMPRQPVKQTLVVVQKHEIKITSTTSLPCLLRKAFYKQDDVFGCASLPMTCRNKSAASAKYLPSKSR